MAATGTDLIKHLGELAFATRLKRLSESLFSDVSRIYREMDVDFEPKWFTMLYALYHNGTMSVIELASLLKLSHPAIIQFAGQMEKAKLVAPMRDKNDARKKLLCLTAKGKQTFEKIEPVLREIEIANREFMRETGADVLGVIGKMEAQLEQKSLYRRVNERLNRKFAGEVRITSYEPKHRSDFKKLNEEWLEKYFTVEPYDRKILDNPTKEILKHDGEIFFAHYNNEVIGTGAVKKTAPQKYELLKMAVTEKFQSRGIGKLLLEKIIEFAKKKKAAVLELDTARKLDKAIRLYESVGFKVSDEKPNPEFERCTIKMKLDLKTVMLLALTTGVSSAILAAWWLQQQLETQNFVSDIIIRILNSVSHSVLVTGFSQ